MQVVEAAPTKIPLPRPGKRPPPLKEHSPPKVFVKKMPFGEETSKGSVVGVVTVLGESLPVEEYEFK